MKSRILISVLFLNLCLTTIVQSQSGAAAQYPVAFEQPLSPRADSIPDTVGTEFRYAFTTNAHRTLPQLSVEFIAQDAALTKQINVTVTFLLTGRNTTIVIPANNGKVGLSINLSSVLKFKIMCRTYGIFKNP